ncbi:hypothetical protein [Mycolicibacterium sp. P9-22]|uniref:hypothetical protein n=1 Tax=Mycolicibacterium sp. P9-22 TaxID=2024613 RepID=UPI0018840BB5|nr:hypothetical protein [Mycolicibacterium sp. P9-22]
MTVHATLLRIAITNPPRVSIPTITAAAIARRWLGASGAAAREAVSLSDSR